MKPADIPEVTTLRQNVGTCPVCRAYLWAEVDVTVDLTAPSFDGENKVAVRARPIMQAMRLSHECNDGEDNRTQI